MSEEEVRLEAISLASELFKGDTNAASTWFSSSNPSFGGDTPLQVCIRGDESYVVDFLLVRLGRKDGAAY